MCDFCKVSLKEGRRACSSSFLLAGLQCDSRCVSSQPGPWGRKPCVQDDGAAIQKNISVILKLLSTPGLHTSLTWMRNKILSGLRNYFGRVFCLFVLLLLLSFTAKPNPNGYFPISIIYVFPIHPWYQNCTAFNVTSCLWMRHGFIGHSHHSPQIPLTSYRANSTHGVTSERSPPWHGKKWNFFFFNQEQMLFILQKTLSIQDDCFLLP